MKRVSQIWGKPYKRGWIIWKPSFMEELRFSDYVEFRGVTVQTQRLRDALRAIPSQDVLLRVNGGLQLEEAQRYFISSPRRKCCHRLVNDGVAMTVKPSRETEGVGVILRLKLKSYRR